MAEPPIVEQQLQEMPRWAGEFSPNSEDARSARASGNSRARPTDVFAWEDEVGEASLQLRTSKWPACAARGGSPWLSPGRDVLRGGGGEPGTRRYSAARAAAARSHFNLADRAEPANAKSSRSPTLSDAAGVVARDCRGDKIGLDLLAGKGSLSLSLLRPSSLPPPSLLPQSLTISL
jgi:hypothetical protein